MFVQNTLPYDKSTNYPGTINQSFKIIIYNNEIPQNIFGKIINADANSLSLDMIGFSIVFITFGLLIGENGN